MSSWSAERAFQLPQVVASSYACNRLEGSHNRRQATLVGSPAASLINYWQLAQGCSWELNQFSLNPRFIPRAPAMLPSYTVTIHVQESSQMHQMSMTTELNTTCVTISSCLRDRASK